MDLFGASTTFLAVASAAALAGVLAVLAWLAWRRPVLVRLGLRAVPRRLLRSMLIVAGLTTSTAVIATAIGTGETMSATIRAVVAGGIGPVDELIVSPGTAPREPGLRDPKAVLAGADLAAGAYFDEAQADRLAARLSADPDFAAIVPALQVQATAVNPVEGRARTGVMVLGLRPGSPVFDRFTAGGQVVSLTELGPGEVLLNAEAARLLGARPGEPLLLTLAADQTLEWRVRAVVADAGLTGINAATIVPLPVLQAALVKPGQINQILVANAGPPGDATISRRATGKLRLALADPEVAARIARALAAETGQSQIKALEARVRPQDRDRIDALRKAARSGRPTPELAYSLGDPRLTTQYRWVLNALAGDPTLRGSDLIQRIAPLTVVDVKARAIDAAGEYGSAVTTVFLILGLFSIAASLLLVFLIFVMLAAERRTEMGLTRAVGAQRHHLVAAFAVEGLAYDLAASLLGLVLGVGIGALVLRLIQRVLDRFDVTVQGHMSGDAIVLSFCLGALVTFLTVLAAAWKVSRVNVIAAIHGLPEPEAARGARFRLGTFLRGLLVLACGAAGAALIALRPNGPTGLAAGASLLVLAVAATIRAALVALGARPQTVDRLVASTAGPLIAFFFTFQPDAPRWLGEDDIRAATGGFVLAGVAMALALVWAAGRNLDVLLMPVRLLARPFGALAPGVRMAVAYPLTHPFRTGLTAAMFALVFLTMVSATALLRSTEEAYVKRDGAAGFDVRAHFASPPQDFRGALAESTSVRIDDFSAIGGLALNQVESLWPQERAAAWRPVELRIADETMLGISAGGMLARAAGFGSDAAVWRAVRDRPGLAIASRNELESLPQVQAAQAAGSSAITFAPTPVWVRDPRGGPARKLMIVGVTSDGTIAPAGLLTSAAAMAGSPAETQPQNEYFLRVREDASYRSAATGVALTFPENGIRTRILGDEQRTGHEVRRLLDTLIRGFLGMGLASGIAALGVVGMRSVAERRQQIGMLRALGFSRRMVQAAFLLEGSMVAILGITVGGVVGLVLARNVVAFLSRDLRELELIVPWWQIGAIAGAAYAAALVSGLIVAWQAGRVSPAEALRYE